MDEGNVAVLAGKKHIYLLSLNLYNLGCNYIILGRYWIIKFFFYLN